MFESPQDGWVYCEISPGKGETEELAKDHQLERVRIRPRFADTTPTFQFLYHSAQEQKWDCHQTWFTRGHQPDSTESGV